MTEQRKRRRAIASITLGVIGASFAYALCGGIAGAHAGGDYLDDILGPFLFPGFSLTLMAIELAVLFTFDKAGHIRRVRMWLVTLFFAAASPLTYDTIKTWVISHDVGPCGQGLGHVVCSDPPQWIIAASWGIAIGIPVFFVILLLLDAVMGFRLPARGKPVAVSFELPVHTGQAAHRLVSEQTLQNANAFLEAQRIQKEGKQKW